MKQDDMVSAAYAQGRRDQRQSDEALLRKALEAMEYSGMNVGKFNRINAACQALRAALAEPVQAPVAWIPIEQIYPQAEAIDILMGDGSILCAVLPQFDGDLWWEGSGTGEKFIDPRYANVTHWRIHGEHTAPPQRKPLTEEEIHDCWQQRHKDKTTERRLITRAIERAHGIKE